MLCLSSDRIFSLRNINFCSFSRKNASDTENYYYNNHFIALHDLLRELGILQNTQEPIEQRKRLLIDVNENKCDLWLREKQRGTMAHMLSKFIRCFVKPKPQQVPARTLSISTGSLYLFLSLKFN